MPVRQPTQGGVQTPGLTGYSSAGVVQPVYRPPQEQGPGFSDFWKGMLPTAAKGLQDVAEQEAARGYLEGQQDSMQGRERQEQGYFTRVAYEQGYNSASVNTALAKFQLGMHNTAQEYVNAGRTPEEFNEYVQAQTNQLLSEAGQQGLTLSDKDWQSWLGQVENTRNTATGTFQDLNLKRAAVLQDQSWGARGNSAVAEFIAAQQSGDTVQALENVNGHLTSIFNDESITADSKVKYASQFMVNAFANAGTTNDMQALTGYIQNLAEFKNLPTDTQTQIMGAAQQYYNQRASDESVSLYEYNSKVAAIQDTKQLNEQYPMDTFVGTIMQGVQQRKLAPSTGYAMIDAESTRRLKLQKAEETQQAYATGVTLTDIASASGQTPDKVKTELTKLYAAQAGGYSGGGLTMMQRGLSSGAQDITGVGIEMLQQDAQSLASVDWRNLKTDSEGKPLYPSTVVNSLTNLQVAYNASLAAGNQVQANQLLSGLPDPVVYGIRQGVDARDLADVVSKRAQDIAAGKVLAHPESISPDLLVSQDDVSAGMFDWGITQGARNRNMLGIQSYVWTSDSDKKMEQARVQQVNSAISNEYTYHSQQGSLPALHGDDLKSWLVGKVAARTVRVDDGTKASSLLILPPVGDKQRVFGSSDNEIIGRALKESVTDFRKEYPQATTVQMDYDPLTQEIIFQGTNSDNQVITSRTSVAASDFRDTVRGVTNEITNSGSGSQKGNLNVPGAGFVQFSTSNKYGIDQRVVMGAVNQLVTYEGYTPAKGFSVLGVHPTTGAKLNEDKYVKQPTDTPQQATDKFNLYLNDKVYPQVMPKLGQYKQLPMHLQNSIYNALVETTYHAGNADAFDKYIQIALTGDITKLPEFRDTALFKDAGAGSRRNKDRYQLLGALVMYRNNQ